MDFFREMIDSLAAACRPWLFEHDLILHVEQGQGEEEECKLL